MSDYPPLPESFDGKLTHVELEELWGTLLKELANPLWFNRKHHNRRTYDAGCQGPMCTKAVREYARRRNRTNPSERYAKIDAVLEFWFPEANRIVLELKHKMLTDIVPQK